ncbi:MAG TPA: OmpA family protein [Burkholderiales bacterium]
MKIHYSIKHAILGAALALASLPGVAAEQQPWEVGLGLGFIDPGSKRDIGSDPAGLITFGGRFNSTWGAEVAAMLGNDISLLGFRGLYHFNELPGAWTPFVSFGAGITDPKPGEHDNTALVGVGVKHPINDNLGLRGEVNAHQGFDSGATDLSLFVGLTWSWGGGMTKAAASTATAAPSVQDGDADGDGVSDSRDRCSVSPAGAKVNSEGCMIDSDGDGVANSLDGCPGTPAGTRVDSQGCPPVGDGDGDGVLDSADRCPDTPSGSNVDAAGCTPVTTAIGDSDGDGVADDMDKCSATPSGARVDADGCSARLTEKVGITLKLNFETDKSAIKPEFSDEIAKVAKFMREYPGSSVVIEGHTDNTGDRDYNQKLSEQRAEAVADSLVRDHGVSADRVKAVGYGDSRPIADNRTAAGRAQNRRVDAAIEETVTR